MSPNKIYSYKDLHDKQPEKESKSKLAPYLLIGGLAVAAVFGGPKMFEKPTEYSGVKTYTFESGQGLNDATMSVDRDTKIPYQEVTKHIEDMPENAKVLSDGIQTGETVSVPERAFK